MRYVVIGGIAVIRHGVMRATKDLDVVVATDESTDEALAELMGRWEATRPVVARPTRRTWTTVYVG